MTPTPLLALLLWPGLWRSAHQALALALVCCVFGATAGVLLGGSPVLLSVCAMLPVLWHAARAPGGVDVDAGPRVDGGWRLPPGALALAALWGWALLVTVFVPRLFEGSTEVIGIVPRGRGIANDLVPLAAQRGNLNQLAYLSFALLTLLAVARLLATPQRRHAFADALLLMAGVNLAVTLLQALYLYAGVPNLLGGLANAGYAIHLGGSVGGLQRLSGGFAEPSGFAAFTLAAHAVCRALARQGHRRPLASALSLGSLAALLLSTSTTAYVGLALLYAGYGAFALGRLLLQPRQVQLGAGAVLAWGAGVLGLAALLLSPGLVDGLAGLAQGTLFGKLDSASGMERGFWNARAWISFTETFGLGVGIGSTRASSYLLVLLSNVGIVGTLLFALFLWQTAGRALHTAPAAPEGAAAGSAAPVAAAHGMLALLAAASVSATVFDLGLLFYLLAGAAACAPVRAGRAQRAAASRPPLWTGARHAG
jgi:hypothetical protein